MSRRLKVLMSAYACEPNRGSEPEVGWQSALHMARFHDVTVVTRANNREVIEAALKGHDGESPAFIYYDPPAWIVSLKKRGLPVSLFYLIWQLGVRWHLRSRLSGYDLIHHVTFNSLVIPGFWWFCPRPVLLGPLGGGQITPWRFLPHFGRRMPVELVRSIIVCCAGYLPHVLLSLVSARSLLAVNQETQKRIPRGLRRSCGRMLETALPTSAFPDKTPSATRQVRSFLWVGRLIRWKGAILALRAFAQALHAHPGLSLTFVGTGPDERVLRELADAHRLGDSVRFLGQVPKHAMVETMQSHDAFLFTSLHDTSGNALLEAMALGLPAIVLNHHGPAEITDNDSALQIPVTNERETTVALARAMERLAGSPELSGRIACAARARAESQFTWAAHTEQMSEIYQRVAS